jgi:hypothetical protein
MAPVAPRVPPAPPPGPLAPEAGTPGEPYLPEAPYVGRDPRLWWQNEVAVVAVGLLMLAIGGVVGYLIGHGNARTRVVAADRRQGNSPIVVQTTTVTTPGQATSVTRVKEVKVKTPAKTVTTPARTVTTPGKTVIVKQPARIVHSTTTRTVTSTTTSTVSSASVTAGGQPQTFDGSGNQSLGTITVPAASQLRWQCTGCSSSTFTVSNSSTDPAQLAVQGQNATSGQTAVAAGKYTSVTVQATGSWSITIATGSS